MKMKVYVAVSALIFVLVSLGHLVRLMEDWPVQVGPFSLPVWASAIALLVSAGVAGWGLSLLRRHS
jgi:hypothetical protein